jgi:hypothetical protein
MCFKKTIVLLAALFLSGCATTKVLSVMGGSKADATLEMVYEYGSFEVPEVNWEAAKASALQRCRAWGYTNVQFFDGGLKTCLSSGQYGCNRWRVTHTAQCLD